MQILQNAMGLCFLGFGVYFAMRISPSIETALSKAIIGITFGLIAFLVTATPVTLPGDATIDVRAGPIILAGVLGGPIGGLIAAVMGGLARGLVGGSFVFSGMVVFFVYAGLGIAIRYFRLVTLNHLFEIRSMAVLVVATLCGASAMFFLISPSETALFWLRHDLPLIWLANTLSVVFSTVALGIAVQFMLKRKEVQDLNETLKLAKTAGKFGVWDFDVRSGFLEWDDRSLELHGIDRADFSNSFEDWAKTVHPEDLKSANEAFSEALQEGETFEAEYRVSKPNGDVAVVKGSAIIMRSPKGAPVRVIGTNLDLTDLRAAEANFLEAKSQAFQAQKLDTIGQITGGVAHDFNNLLAIIMGNQELLRGEVVRGVPNQSDAFELIEASIEATRRGAELTQNMLAYARKAPLVPMETDINQVVRETENWLRRTIEARIEIETVLQAGLWKTLVDRTSLQNALVNLLVNARDAFDGAGQVTIETSNIRIDEFYVAQRRENIDPGNYVMLAVSDNGNGISEDLLGQIFDPFFSTKGPGKGSGLGLSMVQGFVKQSGGAVRVYSELGVGTSFKMYFPAIRNTPQRDDLSSADTVPFAPDSPVNGRILVVEDQPEVLRVLERTLRGAGYEIVTATNGDEAYRIFEQDRRFDLVVTDIVMPGQRQGPRLAKDIRALDPMVRFIFLSGYASEATVHGNGLRPDDVRIMKPVSSNDLLRAVDTVIRRAV